MKQTTKNLTTIGVISLLILTFNSHASDLTIPNQFTSGTRAVAADVNANFDATAVSVNDNQVQLTDLIAQITALTATVNANSATITSLQTENSNLQAEVESLQADSVAGLSGVLTVGTDSQGNTAAIFSGVNLHVNNGTGVGSNVNGLGNFIVGYDEVTTSSVQICSTSIFADQTSCESGGGVWSNSHKSGSHNLIVGTRHNYSQYGAFIAGLGNSVNSPNASILGGDRNLASGQFSSVSGGSDNTASGRKSSVSGGINNESQGTFTSILGGNNNLASSDSSSVSGGNNNIASGISSSVSGGIGGLASGNESTVTGGFNNIASGSRSSVSGGSSGEASGNANWVAGTLFEDN